MARNIGTIGIGRIIVIQRERIKIELFTVQNDYCEYLEVVNAYILQYC